MVVDDELAILFLGMEDPKAHLTLCEPSCIEWQVPSIEWVHIFVHTLE